MTTEPASHDRIIQGAYGVSGRLLLAALAALFVLPAFLEPFGVGPLAGTLLFTLVMVAGAATVAGGRGHRALAGAMLVLLPGLAVLWLQYLGWVDPVGSLGRAFWMYLILMVVITVWRLLRFVLAANRVDAEVLAAGVSIYLLLGLLWSFLYRLVDVYQPGSFHGATGKLTEQDAFYFSLCTLTTAGYGDITPVTHQARTLAIMESVTGVLYIGVLIARLVATYSQEPASRR